MDPQRQAELEGIEQNRMDIAVQRSELAALATENIVMPSDIVGLAIDASVDPNDSPSYTVPSSRMRRAAGIGGL